jgi:hypothetical protein
MNINLSNYDNNTDEWGWFIDVENIKSFELSDEKNKKNKKYKIKIDHVIYQEDEYDFHLNNSKNIDEYSDNIYDIENESCIQNDKKDFYLVEIYSFTILTSVITYVALCIL